MQKAEVEASAHYVYGKEGGEMQKKSESSR
jgi:hypothetical protein